MNFFEHQHQAKRRTFFLVSAYLMGIAVLTASVALASAYLYAFLIHIEQGVPLSEQYRSQEVLAEFNHMIKPVSMIVYLALAPIIILVSLVRYAGYTSGGGAVIARSMGGVLLEPDAAETQEEKVLVNIMAEVGIASGIGHIPVYVLRNDHSINAFAAGTKKENMVIGVTQGAIENLDRDELQGVIAHEMGHVFNNDMRLNVRIAALIHGLMVLVLAGYMLWPRKANGSKMVLVMMVFSILLIVAGYLGKIAGMVVQAAVSREREYLADASAVQYTRNNKGIAGALEKIKKHNSAPVSDPNGEVSANSHFFFQKPCVSGISGFFAGILSTHPPIDDRIDRLRGNKEA